MGERALELPIGLPWLNVNRPLSLAELRGHVVALVLWRGTGIAARQTLALLGRLLDRLAGQPFVVLGAHSVVSDADKVTDRILDTVHRWRVRFPVVVDVESRIPRALGTSVWPTVVLLNATGVIVRTLPGEPHEDALDIAVDELLALERSRAVLTDAPVDLRCEPPRIDGLLAFPSGVTVSSGGRVAISDAGHHRVLVADSEGTIVDVIGMGLAGQRTGAFEDALLDDPQGLSFDEDSILICDVASHQVLRASLSTRTVTVLAGTGALGMAPLRSSRPALEVSLRSPWGVARDREGILVTLPGSNQIARVQRRGEIMPLAGNGESGYRDGPFESALFAEPTAIYPHGGGFLVVDGAGTRLRWLDLEKRVVTTLIASDERLVHDAIARARSGRIWSSVATSPTGSVVVTETTTHVLQSADLRRQQVVTMFEFAQGVGLRDPAALTWEVTRGAWLVTDTGNHRLVLISAHGDEAALFPLSLASSDRTTILPSSGLQTIVEPPPSSGLVPTSGLGPGEGALLLSILVEDGAWMLVPDAPVEVFAEVARGAELIAIPEPAILAVPGTLPRVAISVHALPAGPSLAEVLVRLQVSVLPRNGGAPVRASAAVLLPVVVDPNGGDQLHYEVAIPVAPSSPPGPASRSGTSLPTSPTSPLTACSSPPRRERLSRRLASTKEQPSTRAHGARRRAFPDGRIVTSRGIASASSRACLTWFPRARSTRACIFSKAARSASGDANGSVS